MHLQHCHSTRNPCSGLPSLPPAVKLMQPTGSQPLPSSGTSSSSTNRPGMIYGVNPCNASIGLRRSSRGSFFTNKDRNKMIHMEKQDKFKLRITRSKPPRSLNRKTSENLRLLGISEHQGESESIISYAHYYSHSNTPFQKACYYYMSRGHVSASQAEGRGFDPHLPLKSKRPFEWTVFLFYHRCSQITQIGRRLIASTMIPHQPLQRGPQDGGDMNTFGFGNF
jgi:hypothetical protein